MNVYEPLVLRLAVTGPGAAVAGFLLRFVLLDYRGGDRDERVNARLLPSPVVRLLPCRLRLRAV